MATIREKARTAKATRDVAVRGVGVNIDDIRKETRSAQSVGAQLTRQLNEAPQTVGHERLQTDDFVGQVFDGTNNEFTISRRVFGYNIALKHVVQATGSGFRLDRTSNPAPSAGQFWFDGLFTVRVGTPPAALDGLWADYITAL